MESPEDESVRLTSGFVTDQSKSVISLNAEYMVMRYLFVRKRAAAPENPRFQNRSISRSMVMRCSKKTSTVGAGYWWYGSHASDEIGY